MKPLPLSEGKEGVTPPMSGYGNEDLTKDPMKFLTIASGRKKVALRQYRVTTNTRIIRQNQGDSTWNRREGLTLRSYKKLGFLLFTFSEKEASLKLSGEGGRGKGAATGQRLH